MPEGYGLKVVTLGGPGTPGGVTVVGDVVEFRFNV